MYTLSKWQSLCLHGAPRVKIHRMDIYSVCQGLTIQIWGLTKFEYYTKSYTIQKIVTYKAYILSLILILELLVIYHIYIHIYTHVYAYIYIYTDMYTLILLILINAAWMNMIALKMYFQASITKKPRKISNSKIILRIKKFTAHFPSEHHFRPYIFNVTCRFHILDTITFLLKSIIKNSYGWGAQPETLELLSAHWDHMALLPAYILRQWDSYLHPSVGPIASLPAHCDYWTPTCTLGPHGTLTCSFRPWDSYLHIGDPWQSYMHTETLKLLLTQSGFG